MGGKKYILFFITIIVFTISCKTKYNNPDATKYFQTSKSYLNQKNILYNNIKLTPIKIDTTIECSYVGYFTIFNNHLFFSDIYFNYIFEFDENFKVIKRFAGKGNGPNEVPGFLYFIPEKKKFFLLSPGNSYLYHFDYSGHKTQNVYIEWKGTREEARRMYNDPDPGNFICYEPDFGINDIVKVFDKNHIAFGITASWPKFNGYFNSSLYYNFSRILSIINVNTGQVTKIMGRRSPVYQKYRNIPNFDHFCFEIIKNRIFINFWPDEKIYIIDKSKDIVLSSFGIRGKNMNIDYSITNNYEEAESHRSYDLNKYGYYKYLLFDAKTNILFRGYTKGEDIDFDGLQIYALGNKRLLADLKVPLGFKIIGSINNKFFAQIEDYSNKENLIIYKVDFIK